MLYRTSRYGLARRSHFFASVFSINNGTLEEGVSDENPIHLPSEFTREDFEIFLTYDMR
jgi:hypothetical protein